MFSRGRLVVDDTSHSAEQHVTLVRHIADAQFLARVRDAYYLTVHVVTFDVSVKTKYKTSSFC